MRRHRIVTKNLPRLLFQQPLRFPTRQSLVHHFDRQSKLLPHALAESRRFLRHLATRPIQPQRQPNNNLFYRMLTRQFPQPPHIFISIHALDGRQRPRQRRFDVRQRQPDAHFSIIDRQDRRPANRRDSRSFKIFAL